MRAVINQTAFTVSSAITKALVLAFLLSFIAACTNKAIYQSVQHNEQLKCQKAPPQEYQGCMDQHSQSYQSYKQSRDEIMQGDG